MDYLGVLGQVREEAITECNRLGYRLVLISLSSSNPVDDYLHLVLAEKNDGSSYTVWGYNSESKALFTGVYNLTFKEALENFSSKLR